jgi:hypothetical protein
MDGENRGRIMAREPWKCSHTDCKQECSRKGNLMRHIRRLHKGEGVPVKNKSFDTEKLACSTAHSGLDPRNNISKEEKDKKGQGVKNTVELDPVDSIYPTFKKLKDRNDKIEEMRNYFANNSSIIPFPPNFLHEILNYGKPENLLPYHIRSDFASASVPSTSSTPQVVQSKKVVGYVGYICGRCLEFEPLQIVYDPSSSDKICATQHVCDTDTLNSAMAYPTFFREEVCMYRILDLSGQMMKAVKEWTNGEVFLISSKITSSNIPENTIIIDLRKNEYNWLTRAIIQKYTVLDNKALKEFFTLILNWCATFCCIKFAEEGQQDVKQEYYFLCLSYKPCLPWELR